MIGFESMRTKLLLVFVVFGCATNKAPPPSLWKPEAPLPPSSIAALIAHRADLDLNDEQIAKLTEIDGKRESADRMVEQDLNDQVGDQEKARIRMGNPQMKKMQTRVGKLARENTPTNEPPAEGDYFDVAQQRLAENDQQAWKEAQPLLNDQQRALAQVLVDQYRQDVAKQHEEFQKRPR
jgi:hypothetical protein